MNTGFYWDWDFNEEAQREYVYYSENQCQHSWRKEMTNEESGKIVVDKAEILKALIPFCDGDPTYDDFTALRDLRDKILNEYDDEIGGFSGSLTTNPNPIHQTIMWYIDRLSPESTVEISIYTVNGAVTMSIPAVEIKRLLNNDTGSTLDKVKQQHVDDMRYREKAKEPGE